MAVIPRSSRASQEPPGLRLYSVHCRIRHEISRTLTRIKMGGLLRYLAPELNFDDEDLRANEASDIYSLGMVIYAMGTGNPPCNNHRKELRAALAAQLGERPIRPTALGDLNGPALGDHGEDVVSRSR